MAPIVIISKYTDCLKELFNSWGKDNSNLELENLKITIDNSKKDITISFDIVESKEKNSVYLEIFENDFLHPTQAFINWSINKRSKGERFKIIKEIPESIINEENINKSHMFLFVFYSDCS